jgi:hypothetical protein
MSKYQFIKSRETMVTELNTLWNNYPLYKFICGAQYVRKRELEICACIPNYKGERDMFIELTRFDWLIAEEDNKKKKKKP